MCIRDSHIVAPGETIASAKLDKTCGGKGFNQAAALAKAGAKVYLAGLVGADGGQMLETAQEFGVDCRFVQERDNATGHAIIQVDESSSVSQDLTMEGSVLSNLKIRVYTGEKSISDTLTVELIDKETGDVVYQGEKETDGFTTNSALYSFIGEKVSVEKGKTYELRISSEAEEGSGIGLYLSLIHI